MRLEGKRAIVTGAASGFGRAIAELYAGEGAQVAVLDIDAAGARAVADGIGDAAIPLACDVTDGAAVARAVADAAAAFGGVDVIVNNAGWTHRNKPMLEVSEDEFDRVYAVNVKSIFHMAHAAVPLLRRQGTGG
ncbi:MAG: SDR family NAD(P)-dependent oxidoreductase, partial [Alphaproteobacteria bacterium]|nr:SDR family NAD(P)-dependent oxidoreductase [Alphaproteobacteria bacterium]